MSSVFCQYVERSYIVYIGGMCRPPNNQIPLPNPLCHYEFFTELWNDKVNYFYILYIYGCIESILANIVVKFNKRIDIFHFISIFIDICIYYIIKSSESSLHKLF